MHTKTPLCDLHTAYIDLDNESTSTSASGENRLVDCSSMYEPQRSVVDSGRETDAVCKVATALFSPCTAALNFGYPSGTPCVAVALNKIYGWLPVKGLSTPYSFDGNPSVVPEDVEVACMGHEATDRAVLGELAYLPSQQISAVYFPFLAQTRYRQPLVFVRFVAPPVGQTVAVKCVFAVGDLDTAVAETLGERGVVTPDGYAVTLFNLRID